MFKLLGRLAELIKQLPQESPKNEVPAVFFRFCRRLNWRQKLLLDIGRPLITRKDRIIAVCNPHGPYIGHVRGGIDRRDFDCPCCETIYQAQKAVFKAEHVH